MVTRAEDIRTLADLREYVNVTLCSRDRLETTAFPMTERILMRGSQPCGLYFCVHGPRSLRTTAIWETDSNTILFYGADGQRFHRTRLTGSFA